MLLLQEILVFTIFFIAVVYMVTKFIWKPKFIFGNKKSGKSCESGCDSCH